ncbi:MAG TPA: hypothetical protein PKN13_08575 [Accumulibacter sp.]|nr:hypothetical protein [Accumulibacter sp.]HMW16982.1 hypothetical protein [Accumulibacter sp.]HMX22151.1 hypothetical protein [Accumulibacter sp.]HNC17234.1 hypothetical protein [Accumulibacter sp.]HND79758.1 hypothetical protein [Accumulibacter sp.]
MRRLLTMIASALLLATSCFVYAADAIDAPLHKVGDSWVWGVRVNPRDTCTNGINTGAKQSQTVTEVTESGYKAEITGPREGAKFNLSYGKDLAFNVKDGSEILRSDVFNFPIQEGRSWDTTLRSGNVLTNLTCKAGGNERLKVGQQEFDVSPIVCEGRWKNQQTGNSDQATYKYWYSPEVRNMVRWTVFTYFRGTTCADLEYQIELSSR